MFHIISNLSDNHTYTAQSPSSDLRQRWKTCCKMRLAPCMESPRPVCVSVGPQPQPRDPYHRLCPWLSLEARAILTARSGASDSLMDQWVPTQWTIQPCHRLWQCTVSTSHMQESVNKSKVSGCGTVLQIPLPPLIRFLVAWIRIKSQANVYCVYYCVHIDADNWISDIGYG